MSKNTLYRRPADENPIQLNELPDEPLTEVAFPVTVDPKYPTNLGWFFFMAFSVAVVSAIARASLGMNVGVVAIIVVLILVRFLSNIYKTIGVKVAGYVFTALIITHFSMLLHRPTAGYANICVLLLAVVYTVVLAWRFRLHCITLACGGLLPNSVIRQYKDYGHLPNGMRATPTLEAFGNWLRSWLAYDPNNASAPGLIKSPGGEAQLRVGSSLALIALWSGGLVTFEAMSVLSVLFPKPFVILFVSVFVLPVVVPLLVMFLFSADVLGKTDALKEKQFDPQYFTSFTAKLRSTT